jgi:hypothetical protein
VSGDKNAVASHATQPPPIAVPATEAICDHPFIPSEIGTYLRYRLARNGSDDTSVFVHTLRRTDSLAGRVAQRWQLEASAGQGSASRSYEEARECIPGGDAEDPWSGFTMSMPGTVSGSRWRWPRTLDIGREIKGAVEVKHPNTTTGIRIERSHRVIGREVVEVPAGRFDAYRVQFDETTRVADKAFAVKGDIWIAEGVGLVKMVVQDPQGSGTQELIEHGIRDQDTDNVQATR